ncbi:MAG: transglutaminase domain-containing protein [Butyrivibrio sp.]|nr:transglutaminase domain-containing protein [Butyrivibrio sp.]
MMAIPGFSSEKSMGPAKISAVLSAELKNHIFLFALIVVTLRGSKAPYGALMENYGEAFVYAAVLFAVFFCVLEHLFGMFVKGKAPLFVSVLPAFLLYFLVKDIEDMPYLGMAVIVAAVFRLVFGLFPFREKIVIYGSFVLATLAVFLNFGVHAFSGSDRAERITFVCIAALVLSALQHLFIEKRKDIFPFSYFAIIGVLVALFPVQDEPINWTSVIEAGERIVQSAGSVYDTMSYYFSDAFKGGSFTTGYSSLNNVGGKASSTQRTELILTTSEKPYVYFEDKETGEYMKRRRCVYLEGGKGVDRKNLVMFLQMLYAQQVPKEISQLFSHRSEVGIEYAYLRTKDEIAPMNSYKLTTHGKDIEGGRSDLIHKKGYSIKAGYIDIDYGSPYLASIIKNAANLDNAEPATYDELGEYMKSLYGIDLRNIVTEDEYKDIVVKSSISSEADLDVTGASGRMRELAAELTYGYDSTYDKARAIEEYIRQYTYSLESSDEAPKNVDMTTAQGMSELADSFLFETGKGYCIHYTSAMVMLLRLSGIPAKPALGFCYLYPFEEEDAYKVSGGSAHTWPLVYLENASWISFEPTATYPTAQDMTWNKTYKESSDSEAGIVDPKDLTWYGNSYVQGEVQEIPAFDDPQDIEEKKDTSIRILYIVVAALLCVAALFALLLIGAVVMRKLRYKRGTTEEKLKMDVEQIRKIIRKKSGEDFFDRGFLSDYVKRAPVDLQQELGIVFDVFYRLEYGNPGKDAVTEDDVKRARNIYNALREKKKA